MSEVNPADLHIIAMTHRHGFGHIKPDPAGLEPFIAALHDLVRVGMGDFMSNDPAFQVRLDVVTNSNHPDVRKYRILVRPVMAPIIHNEIGILLAIADKYELACSISNAGIEIRRIGDV